MEQKTKLFKILKRVLAPYQPKLKPALNDESNFSLDIPPKEGELKSEMFATVQIKKNYVAFHLMPVYYYPDLLKNISTDLRKRMQGKSCFNFTKYDEGLFTELSDVVNASFEKYKSEKRLK